MIEKRWFETLLPKPLVGSAVLTASEETLLWSPDRQFSDDLEKNLRLIAAADRMTRAQFVASIAEPIQTIVPYIELYSKFFMPRQHGMLEDVLHAVEDIFTLVHESHPMAEVTYTQPGYYFSRPTFTTFNGGKRMPWRTMEMAGWDVMGRMMSYLTWELAKKRDAAAKVVIDAAIPTGHKLSHTGSIPKSAVDQVIQKSNQIGFPVRQALANPGDLMQMQGWNWVMPQIPDSVSLSLIQNLYYADYGGIQWFASPNATVGTVYFAGSPEQIGWHDTRGSVRTDSDRDIDKGEDRIATRDADHAWTAQSGLTLWTITQI